MFFLVLALLPSIGFALFDDCITVPEDCPNENITFWLYTRANANNPHQLLVDDPESIKSAPFVKDAPIKILVHGYTGHKDFAPNTQIRPEYLKCCDYNIISLDYGPIVKSPCYIQAAKNTKVVGKCTAQLIDEMVTNHGFDLAKIHPIGFSLGAQVVGHLGSFIKSGRFERITGLDPAFPLFATLNEGRKLDAGDAKFVDVIHTNALANGKLEPSGTLDFYANGGSIQPGCSPPSNSSVLSCYHNRAPDYYAESINTDTGFFATPCDPVRTALGVCALSRRSQDPIVFGEYVDKKAIFEEECYHNRAPVYYAESINTDTGFFATPCDPVRTALGVYALSRKSQDPNVFGEYVDKNDKGLYFFSTNSESPFAQGLPDDDEHNTDSLLTRLRKKITP